MAERVVGDCMVGAGIHNDDLLVVNRHLTAQNGDVVVGVLDGDVVVGVLDGEFILRSYITLGGKQYLMPDNKNYAPIERTESTQFEIWGVVPFSLLDQKNRRDDRINRLQQLLR